MVVRFGNGSDNNHSVGRQISRDTDVNRTHHGVIDRNYDFFRDEVGGEIAVLRNRDDARIVSVVVTPTEEDVVLISRSRQGVCAAVIEGAAAGCQAGMLFALSVTLKQYAS